MLILLLAITGQLADVATTALFLRMGFVELNPLVGPNPDIWLLVFIKLAVVAAIVRLCHGRSRQWLLLQASVLGFGAAGWNLYVLQSAT